MAKRSAYSRDTKLTAAWYTTSKQEKPMLHLHLVGMLEGETQFYSAFWYSSQENIP